LANGLGRENLLQSRQAIQDPARAIGRQRALSAWHASLLGIVVEDDLPRRLAELRQWDGASVRQNLWYQAASELLVFNPLVAER
jgi:hypothetical protein